MGKHKKRTVLIYDLVHIYHKLVVRVLLIRSLQCICRSICVWTIKEFSFTASISPSNYYLGEEIESVSISAWLQAFIFCHKLMICSDNDWLGGNTCTYEYLVLCQLSVEADLPARELCQKDKSKKEQEVQKVGSNAKEWWVLLLTYVRRYVVQL